LDAIERAIRAALAKGDADDRGFREKVYRSVFAALERNIAATPELAPEAARRRRDALKARITDIEQEFIPAVEADRPSPSNGQPAPAVYARPENGAAPSVDPTGGSAGEAPAPAVELGPRSPAAHGIPVPDARREPSFGAGEPDMPVERVASPEADMAFADGDPGIEGPGGAYERSAGGRRPRRFGAIFAGVTLIATLAVLLWIAFELGLIRPPSAPAPQQETAEPQPPVQPGPAAGPGTADASRDWVTVFSPSDPTSVVAPAGAQADIVDEEGTTYIRVRSGKGGEAVLFDVGQGILERLAGHRAVFDVVARAQDDKDTQISIDCNFGELGDCGRRRYTVGPGRADYLFDIELPDIRPGAAGTIAITSDVDNSGKAIEIYEIKVSLSD
jgi:hypothetical protein